MIVAGILIALGLWACWELYGLSKARDTYRMAKAERMRLERVAALQLDLDRARISGYWAERGQRIRPLATRMCSEVDETT